MKQSLTIRLLAAGVLLAANTSFAQTLSAPEAKIVSAVDKGNAAAEALLETLVNMNSGTFNIAGVTAVGKALEQQFQTLGFKTTLVNEDAVKRAPSLLAEHRGRRGGKRLLLIGHMDTVFEPTHPFQRFERNGNIVKGPGVNDMKGGLVVMIAGLKAMQSAGLLKDANINVFISGDEEAAGDPLESSRKDMIAAAKNADIALSFEGVVVHDGLDYASTARRGATQWRLNVKGKAAHSGGIFTKDTGDGAAFEMSRILAQFHDTLREPNMTYSVGLVLAGSQINVQPNGYASVTGKSNIVPGEAVAIGDLRVLSPDQLTRVEDKMKAIVAASLPVTQSTLTIEQGYPPMAPTQGNVALLTELNVVNKSLGSPPMQALDPMLRGAGDVSFIAPFIDALDGMGLAGEGSHTALETADLSRLPLQTKRVALLLHRLSQAKRK